jgi:hypothetical protein
MCRQGSRACVFSGSGFAPTRRVPRGLDFAVDVGTDTGDTNEVVPLADKSCTLSIITRVVEYLKKHAEFEASNADDEVIVSS